MIPLEACSCGIANTALHFGPIVLRFALACFGSSHPPLLRTLACSDLCPCQCDSECWILMITRLDGPSRRSSYEVSVTVIRTCHVSMNDDCCDGIGTRYLLLLC